MNLIKIVIIMALFSSSMKAQTLEPKASIYEVNINKNSTTCGVFI